MTDEQLVHDAQAGDRRAFEQLVRRHQGMVYSCAYQIVQSFPDAQDVAQDAFLQAYQNLGSLADRSRFSAWLRSITRNVARHRLRGRKRFLLLFGSDADLALISPDPTPEERQEYRDLVRNVASLLTRLPETNRQTVTLYYFDGLSDVEIGQVLDISPGAVRVRLHRAKQQLKSEAVNMVKKALEGNQPEADFADQVMKRLRVTGIGMGDKQGNILLSTAEERQIVVSMPREWAMPIAYGPKPWFGPKGINGATADDPDELDFFDRKNDPGIFGFLGDLMSAFDMQLPQIIMDCEGETLSATAVIKQAGTSRAIRLSPRDGIVLAGQLEVPLLATSRVIEQVSFADGGSGKVPKERILARPATRPAVSWRQLLDRALGYQADQICAQLEGGEAGVAYARGGEQVGSDTIDADSYQGVRRFIEEHVKDNRNPVYVRKDGRTHALNLSLPGASSGTDAPLGIAIRLWPEEPRDTSAVHPT